MLTSLYTAISGMNAMGTSLSVISDNIANMNTVGFKSSTVSFGDVLSQSLTGASGSSQVGRGVEVTAVSPLFTQGSFQSTASGLDLAIDGDGLFMVNQGPARFYTRAGQFSLDKDGKIVSPDGLVLQGYLADNLGNITGATGDIKIATRQSQANASTKAVLTLNLDSTATAPALPFTLGVNRDTPANYNSSTTINVYDSQGTAHPVTAYFVKGAAANTWTVHYAYADPNNAGKLMEGGQSSGGAGNPPVGVAQTQAMTFDTAGSLLTDNSAVAINFNFGPSVTASAVNFQYGVGTNDASTQFATAFAVMKLSQDGYAAGSLKSMSVSGDGIIAGSFTNGQTRAIGQVALARFIAPTALAKLGRNLYGESFSSGQPIVGKANTSGFGKTLSNSLEQSNVDLAEEFVKMISAQRGFEANSRIITTTDTLMAALVNLGR
jgi:flagellar hook protein FlgE